MNFSSQVVINATIENLMLEVSKHIELETIKKMIPTFLMFEIQQQMANNLNAMTLNFPLKNPLIQQNVGDVPCLHKDTLMPKQIDRQSIVDDNPSSVNVTLTSQGIKHKRQHVSRLNSLSLSSKPNSLINTERRQSKLNKSEMKQGSRMETLKYLDHDQDPQIQRLRKKTEIRLQGQFQYKKMQLNHQKSFREKAEALSNMGLEDPMVTITHDYDGQSIKSMIIDDKIKIYSARLGLGPPTKKFIDGNKAYISPQTSQITKNRIAKERQISRQLKAMEIPLFPQAQSPTLMQPGFKNYRLNQYKKHFGKGYSRLDQVSKTIDYGPTKDLTDEIFQQKKHLNDSQQMSTLARSQLDHSQVSRRLALPKLHGRYKVLDRYEEL